MDGSAISIGVPSMVLLASGVVSFLIRQTAGPDIEARRWITWGFGMAMIVAGLVGTFVASSIALLPAW